MHPCVEIFCLCYLSIESPSFVYICFSFVSLSLILAKRLFHLKHYKGILEIWLRLIFSYFEVHVVRYLRGYENEGLGGVCESELETPLAASGISLAPN